MIISSLINHVFRYNAVRYKPLQPVLLTSESNGASDINITGTLPSSAEP